MEKKIFSGDRKIRGRDFLCQRMCSFCAFCPWQLTFQFPVYFWHFRRLLHQNRTLESGDYFATNKVNVEHTCGFTRRCFRSIWQDALWIAKRRSGVDGSVRRVVLAEGIHVRHDAVRLSVHRSVQGAVMQVVERHPSRIDLQSL